MDFVTVSTGLILPYWMGLPIRYIQLRKKLIIKVIGIKKIGVYMNNEIIKFVNGNLELDFTASLDKDTVWLTQK